VRPAAALAVALAPVGSPRAHEPAIGLPTMEITAAPGLLIGEATAASEGTVTQREIDSRPSLRPADVLELVPGMIVTQHSGAGKANQYFLRGFNLDHGTDFLTRVNGMPVNMPTHAHGQGYTDLNFLVPELVQRLDYHKGPYYAEVGDFASVGFVDMEYFRVLPRNLVQVEVGNYDYWRALGAASPRVGNGNVLVAGEVVGDNGPWDVPQDYRKLNGVLSYAQGNAANGWQVAAMGYRAKWTSTDQVPQRALDQGLIGRFGSLDPTNGGESWRYSLSARWARTDANRATLANAWFIGYSLDLYSNFTYFLDNPDKGDPVRAARPSSGRWSRPRAEVVRRLGQRALREYRRLRHPLRPHRPGRALPDERARAPRHGAPGQRQRVERRALGAERHALDAVAADRCRPAWRALRLRSVEQPASELGHRKRAEAAAKILARPRAVGTHGVVRKLRAGLPFERRARHDDADQPRSARSGIPRAGDPGHAARRNRGLRVGPPVGAVRRFPDNAGAVAAGP